MLLVLASEFDRKARALIERLPRGRAALLTVNDVAGPGLSVTFGREADSVVRVDGRTLHASELEGVVTRLPGVLADELYRVTPEDRGYVATEVHAFLSYWLSALPCSVVNRPSPNCLVGPSLRPEEWTLAAARAGMAVRGVDRTTGAVEAPRAAEGERFSLVVVGDACFGAGAQSLRQAALALARAVDVALLEVRFERTGDGARFLGASLTPELGDAERVDALLGHLASQR